jgi:hypothetical protein
MGQVKSAQEKDGNSSKTSKNFEYYYGKFTTIQQIQYYNNTEG